MTVSDAERGSARATLALVAELASVSTATVSKVLNGREGVSSSTRSRVEALLREHDYNRRDAGKPVRLIELVVSELETTFALDIIRGAEQAVREHGMSLVVTRSGDRQTPGREWLGEVLERQPSGIVFVFADPAQESRAQLRIRNIPFVIVDPAGDPPPDVASVGAANWSGGFAATRHLIQLGHRRIGAIMGAAELMASKARISGYRAALTESNIPINEELITPGFHRKGHGFEQGLRLLSLPTPPSAIFTGDLQALGVYEAARQLGLHIPADLSVVGFDDSPIAQLASPPLTTIRQPVLEMARQAVDLLFKPELLLDRTRVTRIELATQLVVRESTAPPREMS